MLSMNDQSRISSILIATDGSVYADAATECGAWLAAHIDAQVTAIYVIDARRLAGHFIKHFSEVVGGDRSAGLVTRVREYYQSHGQQTLARAAMICERHGVGCRTKLETGNVVK